jgi:hypothetical protein
VIVPGGGHGGGPGPADGPGGGPVAQVPIPGTVWLLGVGLAMIGLFGRSRGSKRG